MRRYGLASLGLAGNELQCCLCLILPPITENMRTSRSLLRINSHLVCGAIRIARKLMWRTLWRGRRYLFPCGSSQHGQADRKPCAFAMWVAHIVNSWGSDRSIAYVHCDLSVIMQCHGPRYHRHKILDQTARAGGTLRIACRRAYCRTCIRVQICHDHRRRLHHRHRGPPNQKGPAIRPYRHR